MACRVPQLPLLPGLTFNNTIGQTRFHKSQHFDHVGSVSYLSDKVKPGIGGGPVPGRSISRYPSIYARGEVCELPAWVAFDKQILCFGAFFQETVQEMRGSPYQIRRCKIYFYLEDGTVKVVEPKVDNSGIPQGTLIGRQRIPMPPPKHGYFYDIIDFNIGKEIELFGKVFKITSCDHFTRTFLNRLGIPVPDPIDTPKDPYYMERDKLLDAIQPKKPKRNIDKFGQFLAFDRKVLRFYAYWDDRATEDGILHNLELNYYLADDTIEIKDVFEDCGIKKGGTFIKRAKLPKFYSGLTHPGHDNPFTVLNVLGPGLQGGRYVADPLNAGMSHHEYYKQNDLAIGAAINVYGRKVVLTDCDPFTKEYYRAKFGLDDFTPAEKPKVEEKVISVPLYKRKLPPWNGFGTFEDSAQNCVTVEPKQIFRDFKKFLNYDKKGLDSHTLRFRANMLSKRPENCSRRFIICYYLSDDTISVHEVADKYSGSTFLTRGPIKIPFQDVFTSDPPDYYQPQHMFIGATVNFNGFTFVLVDADEYALRYMEIHSHKYPKSNINIVLKKVQEKLRPIYKDFVAEHLPKELPVITYGELRTKLCSIMGDDWTEHEMITLARAFSAVCREKRYDSNFIRSLLLTELKKNLWDNLDRLKENLLYFDKERTGFLPRNVVYTILRGIKLPVDKFLLDNMLDVIKKNESCEIDCNDLLQFIDKDVNPMCDIIPLNIKRELWWASEPELTAGKLIDWCAFNKALDLEKLFKEPIVLVETKTHKG